MSISDTPRTTGKSQTSMWFSMLAALIGIWILASPFVFEATDEGMWNNVIVGSVVFVLGAYAVFRTMNELSVSIIVTALIAILGLWAVIAPYAFDIGVNELLWSNIIAGLVVFLTSVYATYLDRNQRATRPDPA